MAARHYGIDLRESARSENFPKWLHLLVAHSNDGNREGDGGGAGSSGGAKSGGDGGGGGVGEGGVLKTQGPMSIKQASSDVAKGLLELTHSEQQVRNVKNISGHIHR